LNIFVGQYQSTMVNTGFRSLVIPEKDVRDVYHMSSYS